MIIVTFIGIPKTFNLHILLFNVFPQTLYYYGRSFFFTLFDKSPSMNLGDKNS